MIRTAGEGPCAVRVTHIQTGIAVTVDDQATIRKTGSTQSPFSLMRSKPKLDGDRNEPT